LNTELDTTNNNDQKQQQQQQQQQQQLEDEDEEEFITEDTDMAARTRPFARHIPSTVKPAIPVAPAAPSMLLIDSTMRERERE
jgi:hypothetical protein